MNFRKCTILILRQTYFQNAKRNVNKSVETFFDFKSKVQLSRVEHRHEKKKARAHPFAFFQSVQIRSR